MLLSRKQSETYVPIKQLVRKGYRLAGEREHRPDPRPIRRLISVAVASSRIGGQWVLAVETQNESTASVVY